MVVNIDNLKTIISFMLDKIKNKKGENIEIENDFYWDIDSSEKYNPYKEPKNLSLGQLSDDIKEINKVLVKSDEAIPYDLKRIAEVLRALVDENPTIF